MTDTTTKSRIELSEVAYFAWMFTAGVDTLLWEGDGGLIRLTRDDLPAVPAFLNASAMFSFPSVRQGNPDAAMNGGGK